MSNPSIKIGNNFYKLSEIYGKTIYARKKVNLYKSRVKNAPSVATIQAGGLIGIVQGFIANGYKGAVNSFLIIGNSTKDPNMRLVPYAPENFSETAIKDQGGKSTKDIVKDEIEQQQPWYIKLTKAAAPALALAGLAYFLIKKK